MAVEELTDDTFDERLAGSKQAVVDFYAGWCGPCMMFKPKYQRLSEEYSDVDFFVCDGEKAPQSRSKVQIDNLPYFGLYRDGVFIRGFTTTKEAGFREYLEEAFGGPSAKRP